MGGQIEYIEENIIRCLKCDITSILKKLKSILDQFNFVRTKSINKKYMIEFRFKDYPNLHVIITQNDRGVDINVHEDIAYHYGAFTKRCEDLLANIKEVLTQKIG